MILANSMHAYKKPTYCAHCRHSVIQCFPRLLLLCEAWCKRFSFLSPHKDEASLTENDYEADSTFPKCVSLQPSDNDVVTGQLLLSFIIFCSGHVTLLSGPRRPCKNTHNGYNRDKRSNCSLHSGGESTRTLVFISGWISVSDHISCIDNV